MDQIANQFDAGGAMEHWGLITYGDTGFLIAENYSSSAAINSIVMVNAHEIAHQWTGNLVTCNWWDEIWLNEGMAQFFQYYGVSLYDPEMRSRDRFYTDEQMYMLGYDDSPTSRPILVQMEHADQAMFDSITYDKGACMMRHMEAIVGFDGLKNGVSYYLKENQYGTGTTQNFFDHLTASAVWDGILDPSVDVAELMHNYFYLKNYPVIAVTRDYFRNTASVTQSRYLREPDTSGDATTYDWIIPLTWTTIGDGIDISNPVAQIYFRPEEGFKEVGVGASNLPVIFNIEAKVYARVNYDQQNWDLISQYMATQDLSEIHPINRASILNDAFHLAKSGILPDYSVFFDLVNNYLPLETDYIPKRAAQRIHGALNELSNSGTAPPDALNALSALNNLFISQYSSFKMTFDPSDTFLELLWKQYMVDIVCNLIGDAQCENDAVVEFNAWMNGPNPQQSNPINENVRATVYCTALKLGGQTENDFLQGIYDASFDTQERKIMRNAFGCSPVKGVLRRQLDSILDKRMHDSFDLFHYIHTNANGRELAVEWFEENRNLLETRLTKLFDEIKYYLQV